MRSVALWPDVDGWIVAAAIGIPIVGRIVIVIIALWGANPADRAKIIRAVAELFRWWRRTGADERHE